MKSLELNSVKSTEMTDKSSEKIVYMDEIPKGKSIHDYPPGTNFVYRKIKLERDPVTGRLKRE